MLAHDASTTLAEAIRLHGLADRPNLFIKIPGTSEGLAAIEETIFAGVPVNVTLLFSTAQYLACMEAYTRGIERRVAAGLTGVRRRRSRRSSSAAGTAPSRPGAGRPPQPARARDRRSRPTPSTAGSSQAIAGSASLNAGARAQRLLFASTGTKDPAASDVLYVEGLAAPNTVDTMPEETLLAFADHGRVGQPLVADAAAAAASLARFTAAGIDVAALGDALQARGAASFIASWTSLMERIQAKVDEIALAAR